MVVEEIAASKFKLNCLSVVERVRKTGQPVRITRYGKPVAKIVPDSGPKPGKRRLGGMEHTILYMGDVVSPAFDENEFDALRD